MPPTPKQKKDEGDQAEKEEAAVGGSFAPKCHTGSAVEGKAKGRIHRTELCSGNIVQAGLSIR